jgi:hypothetical protein
MIMLLINDSASISFFSGTPLYFLTAFLNLLLGWLILSKAVAITDFVVSKSNYSSQVRLSAGGKQLLSLFILFLALTSLLAAIPPVLKNIYTSFKETAGAGNMFDEAPKKIDWFTSIIELVLPCLMIVYCRPLTDYFSNNIHFNDNITITEKPANEESY